MIFQRTHCYRGHAMTPDNVRLVGSKRQRVCVACQQLRKQMYKAGHKVARAPVTTCHKGHEFTEENTYYTTHRDGTTTKRCRTCFLEKCHKIYWKDPKGAVRKQVSYGAPRQAAQRRSLDTEYILTRLQSRGVSREQARENPEMIEALREHIRLQRLVKKKKSETKPHIHGKSS